MENPSEVKQPLKQKVIRWIKESRGAIIGSVIGGIGGYVYYRTVGCSSGACPITSSPLMSILWGVALGYLVGDIFRKSKKNSEK
ncbi:MAG TPA: hypothetical protein PKN48_11915 [Bacteroidales bacterium]|nr:hypothetical protein [Bacteroidales bacterium]